MKNSTEQLEYARRLYDNVLEWYRNADSKAQVILAIDGGFIAFVSSAVLTKPADLNAILGSFPLAAWIALTLMIISLLGSIGASIFCLWSRIYSKKEIHDIFEATAITEIEGKSLEGYPPSLAFFFQFIEQMDKDKFGKTLATLDFQFELSALTDEIHTLAGNVRKKHFAVNVGFLLAATALITFFGVAIIYSFTVY